MINLITEDLQLVRYYLILRLLIFKHSFFVFYALKSIHIFTLVILDEFFHVKFESPFSLPILDLLFLHERSKHSPLLLGEPQSVHELTILIDVQSCVARVRN